MGDELQRFFVIRGEDAELDAIKICVEAISDLEDIGERGRVAAYLQERFPCIATTEDTKP